MFKTLINAFRDKGTRKKLFITFGILFLYIIGTWVPVPGINKEIFASETGDFLELMDSVNGGALSNGAILALGVTPYIFSSIIVMLAAMVIPSLEKMQNEGDEDSRRKMNLYTRFVALGLAIVQAIGYVVGYSNKGGIDPVLFNSTAISSVFVIVVLISGAMFTVWLGEKITEHGVGNGLSLLVFIGIVSSVSAGVLESIKSVFSSIENLDELWTLTIFLVSLFIIVSLIVFFDLAKRVIPVNHKKQSNDMPYGKQNNDLELKVNANGVMPIIFATSFLWFPNVLMMLFGDNSSDFAVWYTSTFSSGSLAYCLVLIGLVVAFSYFWSASRFKPELMAKRLYERGSLITGIKPGDNTAKFLRKTNNRLTLFGAIFLSAVALVPTLVFSTIDSSTLINAFTGTGLLIIVSVAIEFNRKLEDQLIYDGYQGFLN